MSPAAGSEEDRRPDPIKEATRDAWEVRCSLMFEELRRPARAMIARAYGKALSDDEVDDVYSAAWTATLSALRKRGAKMGDHELRAYVLTAVASHASKELRRRSRKPTAVLDTPQEHAVADRLQPLPDERAIGSESQSIARDLLTSLPPRRRAVMLLRYGWGLSPDEVCALISGLSRRAYRKEVTRGVEELVERLVQVESGEWCASREPMLRDYLAGTADEATRLQVEQHLRHCRACAELSSRMRDELNDLSGLVILGTAAGFVIGPTGSVIDRLGAMLQSGRDATSAIAEKAEVAVGTVSASGGVRGAGAAGAGISAKFAAAGTAGKAALACLGAGAAATACVAAGVVPGVTLDGLGIGAQSTAKEAPLPDRRDPAPPVRVLRESSASSPPSAVIEPDPPEPPQTGQAPPQEAAEGTAESAPEVAPVEEFDPVAPAPQAAPPVAPPPPPPSQSQPPGSGGGGTSIAGEEFGP